MKKAKNYIMKAASFLILGACMFQLILPLFTPKWYYPNSILKEPITRTLTGIYEEAPMSLDIIFCGTSHVLYGIVPMELYEKRNIKSYVLASSCQPIQMTYYLLKETLKTQTPTIFVYDASSLFLGNSQEVYWRYILDCMPFSKNKYDAAKTFSGTFEQITLLEALSPFYNYHTRWDSLAKLDFTDYCRIDRFYTKGGFVNSEYAPSHSIDEMNTIAENPITPHASISQEVIDWLNKIKKLCAENNIEFLVTKIPSVHLPTIYGSAWTKQRSEEVRRICEENGIEFYDLLYDTIASIDTNTDFADGGYHLNFLGAQKMSALLGDYLASHYTLDTKRTSEWDADFYTYKKVREIALLQLDYNFESYLTRLKDLLSDKTVFISASNEMSAGLSDGDKQLLRSFGIQTDFSDAYQRSFIAVIDNGVVTYEELSDSKISYTGNTSRSGSIYYLLSSNYNTGPSSEIVINGKNYSRNGSGLNIVVYDEESQTVIMVS